jgi:hypothetical protein
MEENIVRILNLVGGRYPIGLPWDSSSEYLNDLCHLSNIGPSIIRYNDLPKICAQLVSGTIVAGGRSGAKATIRMNRQ